MKVVESIESLYNNQHVLVEKLQKKVQEIILSFKRENWFYRGRIKQLESFALKLETGRFKSSDFLEDFFACTIVVENLNQIKTAISLIKKNFSVIDQKPKKFEFTHKLSHSFEFDDLRLYVKIKKAHYLPPDILSTIVFEIQIKTFLQYAWSIATHDLIYKTDSISWPKERISYQIKAMLEQAEISISGVEALTNVPEISKENFVTEKQKNVLKFYLNYFNREELPKDLIRLCNNTIDLINSIKLSIIDLTVIIESENNAGRGIKLKNLSPYLLVIQSIFYQQPNLFRVYLNSTEEKKFKILLPKEVDLNSFLIESTINIVSIKSS